MDKINFIFRQLLDSRTNVGISFDEAGNQALHSGQVYWEYLNQLKEAIENYLKPYNFSCRIIIIDKFIQIEIYSGPIEGIPFLTLKFGVTSEFNNSTKEQFINCGFYSYLKTILNLVLPNMVHPICVIENLEKQIQLYQVNNSNLNESKTQKIWRQKIL